MLYLVRHCQAAGQEPDAPLTPLGQEQAHTLAVRLKRLGVARIVSSPFTRAWASVVPLAAETGLPIEHDERLMERVLSSAQLPDWRERLLASWADFDLALPGGESSRAATLRGLAALDSVLAAEDRLPAVVVAHGNLISLLLHAFDGRPGFDAWQALSNPDVFQVERQAASSGAVLAWRVTRLWEA
ncbi:MAG: histidine phosphatase family protein [Chloroflexota bacterium]